MKISIKILAVCSLMSVSVISVSCAQQGMDSQQSYYENREETREAMKQSAREIGQMAQDFKAFYRDLREAFQESGVYEALDMGTSGFGSADIQVKNEMMIVTMDLPGVNKKELSVKLRGQKVLEIQGQRIASREIEFEEEEHEFYRKDRYHGRFERTMELPYRADVQKRLKASYQDGILTVTIPMAEKPEAEIVEIPIS